MGVPKIAKYTVEVEASLFDDNHFANESKDTRSQGQEFGYNAVWRPEANQNNGEIPEVLAKDEDFQKGLLEGLRVAAYRTADMGEEPTL